MIERRKLHLCSAAHSSAATVIDGSKVLVFTPHRLTRSSSMTPSSLYLLPSIMYYTTNRTFLQGFSQNQAHFVRGYASAATLRPSPAPLSSGSYAIFGGDAVFVRTFCNSIPKSVRISNFLGMRCTKSLNSFAVCPLPFLYGKSTRNVVYSLCIQPGRFPALGSGYPLWMNPSAEVHRACRPAGRAAGVSPACIVQNGKTY